MMKSSFLLLLPALLLLCQLASGKLRKAKPWTKIQKPLRQGLTAEWESFKLEHSKSYEDRAEEGRRQEVFRRNKKLIEDHNKEFNAGRKTYALGMNHFGDMSHEEFVSTMNGFKRGLDESMAEGHGVTFLPPHHFKVPQAVDWREHGYVTPVKNQGQCGSCWSFSATGALEGQHKRKSGKLVSLSEQNLIDCSTRFGNNGCNGGLMDQAFQYIKVNDGIDTERSYPYEAKDDRCRYKKRNLGAEDKGFVDVDHGNETALKIASASVGPISVAIDASHESFQFYKHGVYYEEECSSTQLDHGVLVVGYGTDQDSGKDYWIVKNSWSPKWGLDGYVHMARNEDNNCGVASSASYPLV